MTPEFKVGTPPWLWFSYAFLHILTFYVIDLKVLTQGAGLQFVICRIFQD